eukprot:3603122-Amphidinium_carterae.1
MNEFVDVAMLTSGPVHHDSKSIRFTFFGNGGVILRHWSRWVAQDWQIEDGSLWDIAVTNQAKEILTVVEQLMVRSEFTQMPAQRQLPVQLFSAWVKKVIAGKISHGPLLGYAYVCDHPIHWQQDLQGTKYLMPVLTRSQQAEHGTGGSAFLTLHP